MYAIQRIRNGKFHNLIRLKYVYNTLDTAHALSLLLFWRSNGRSQNLVLGGSTTKKKSL